ncbi:hypothetical protein lerEdw1_005344 [Lerista edwardsae]|nr:hypothetical protein lerEdw1_005344 [Lerista edwardsae]
MKPLPGLSAWCKVTAGYRQPPQYNEDECSKEEQKIDADVPPKSEIRRLKLKELKSKLATQQQLMAKPKSQSVNATIASFKFVEDNFKDGFSILLLMKGQQKSFCTDVRWLSRQKFLQTDLLNEIRSFLKERGDDQAELEDGEWLCDLAFLADFTGELIDMNFELQGKNKCIGKMMSKVSSYKSKFELMMTDLANNTFDHFPNTQDHLGQYPNFVFQNEKYVTEICSVIQEIENRLCDFQKIGTVVEYLSYPFKVDVDIKETAAAISKNYSLNKPSLENEILTLKNDIFLKTMLSKNRFES